MENCSDLSWYFQAALHLHFGTGRCSRSCERCPNSIHITIFNGLFDTNGITHDIYRRNVFVSDDFLFPATTVTVNPKLPVKSMLQGTERKSNDGILFTNFRYLHVFLDFFVYLFRLLLLLLLDVDVFWLHFIIRQPSSHSSRSI